MNFHVASGGGEVAINFDFPARGGGGGGGGVGGLQ